VLSKLVPVWIWDRAMCTEEYASKMLASHSIACCQHPAGSSDVWWSRANYKSRH